MAHNHQSEEEDAYRLLGAIFLVSCVKSKRAHQASARDLYTSTLFQGSRRLSERLAKRWYILSAKYGLVEPSQVIEPYELTLNRLGIAERRKWAEIVVDRLMTHEPDLAHVAFLAGQRYREFVIPALSSKGIAIDVPMMHLRQGEQLAWLARRI